MKNKTLIKLNKIVNKNFILKPYRKFSINKFTIAQAYPTPIKLPYTLLK